MSPNGRRPTDAGEAVLHPTHGVGITTDAPRYRTDRVAVQFLGRPYPVFVDVDSLEVVRIDTV